MADLLANLQAQIANQLAAINVAQQSATLSGSVKTKLIASANTLQGLLDKLLLGGALTPADQQTLAANLDGSQKAILAAKSNRTQLIVMGIAGVALVTTIIVIGIKHKKKT
jgi:hypothetical protein